MKYIKLVDGLKSNANGFEYKIGEINESETWNPTTFDPALMGGFNFSVENKILRWIHRGDTIYDVIIPEDAEIILCDEEKGIYRSNKIIVTNPRILNNKKCFGLSIFNLFLIKINFFLFLKYFNNK